jgi:hypothetical protein
MHRMNLLPGIEVKANLMEGWGGTWLYRLILLLDTNKGQTLSEKWRDGKKIGAPPRYIGES